MSAADRETYFATMSREMGRNPGNLRFGLARLFDGVDLEGRTVLDIGAGDGDASLYAACSGAVRVVSLEPESTGSSSGTAARFERVRSSLGADAVELRNETLQDFRSAERFDVLVSIASINHLDEQACMRLQQDEDAVARYKELLEKLAGLAAPGAKLIVSDATRRNLFGDLGVRNPIAPTIEWEKHQPPGLWASLLEAVGFRDPRIRWNSLNTLRHPGRWLLANRVAAYMLTSMFTLTMTRDERD